MFRFRLQRILELREQKEQAEARALAAAKRTADLAVEQQTLLVAIREDSQQQLQATAAAAPRVGHLHQLGAVLTAIDARLMSATEAVAVADAGVAAAQAQLEAAARDRKVLDRLRSRHAEAWRADTAQQDRVSMDEIALTRYTRQHDRPAGERASGSPSDTSVR